MNEAIDAKNHDLLDIVEWLKEAADIAKNLSDDEVAERDMDSREKLDAGLAGIDGLIEKVQTVLQVYRLPEVKTDGE
jgi:hypothetical protein